MLKTCYYHMSSRFVYSFKRCLIRILLCKMNENWMKTTKITMAKLLTYLVMVLA